MERQQQQQQQVNCAILRGIDRLSDPRHCHEDHKMLLDGADRQVNRHSLEHLVNFLDNHNNDDDSHHEAVAITELELFHLELSEPSDGGLTVLRSFFSRSDTTLTKVEMYNCKFGIQEDASQLLTAFETNTTVTDLTIQRIHNLEGVALGACLSRVLQGKMTLQRLECSDGRLRDEGIRAFQPALQVNRTLRELRLLRCDIQDEGIHFLADSLVGNTTMEVFDISHNLITSAGLDDVRRLLESTRIQQISLEHNDDIFTDEASTHRFAHALSRHEFLKDLNLSHCRLGDQGIRIIVDGLVGNNTIIEILDICFSNLTPNGLNHITRLLESTRLHVIRLGFNPGVFDDENATRHFAVGLGVNHHVKELHINSCNLSNEGIHIIADGLIAGNNTALERLQLGQNITSNSLVAIARLLESKQLKTIYLSAITGLLHDEDATQHFVRALKHKQSSVQDLPGIHPYLFPRNIRAAAYRSITNSLIRNQQLNHVNLLLAPPPPQQQQQPRNATTRMLKISLKAITKFATVHNNSGASAIFKLFQARPAILEKRIIRPTNDSSSHDAASNKGKRGDGEITVISSFAGQKRRRM